MAAASDGADRPRWPQRIEGEAGYEVRCRTAGQPRIWVELEGRRDRSAHHLRLGPRRPRATGNRHGSSWVAPVVIIFALLAALSNAVNEATQHIASTAAPRRSSGWRLVLYLFRNPLWLFGWVALAAAFLFQALALHNGLVSVVQPLLATELVFMLVLRRFWLHQSIRLITWGAAALTCVSLAVFVVAGQPGGGQPTPISHRWFTAGLACCAGAAVLAVVARWGSPSRRAALWRRSRSP